MAKMSPEFIFQRQALSSELARLRLILISFINTRPAQTDEDKKEKVRQTWYTIAVSRKRRQRFKQKPIK